MTTPGRLVAVVDDDLAVLKALGRVLRAAGYETATYSSAEEFLSAPPSKGVHCLIADVQLLGMSGLELQRRLRGEGSRLPVIILTGHDSEQVRREAQSDGCVGYFDKQTDMQDVLAVLAAL